MNIRLRFKLIALLIVLSLAGLLVFQGYWLKGLYDTLYKQMEINIEEAMKIADYKELFLRIRSIKKEQGALGPQTQDVYFSSELDPSNKQKMDAKASIHPQKEDPDLNREDIFKTANPDSHMKLHIDYGDEEDFSSIDSTLTDYLYVIGEVEDMVQQAMHANIDSIKPILTQMKGILISSFLLLLLIICAFIYLLRTILKQKTVEELKTDFTNNMTHELKTPISVSYAAVDALLNFSDPVNEKQKKYLTIVKDQLIHLTGLVEQILTLAVENRSTFRLRPETISLNELVNSLIEQYKLKASKPVEFTCSIPEDIELVADRTHLYNMLSNLIDNAIKYADKEPCRIEATARQDNHETTISITDNGPGISEANQRQIFDKFFRVPSGNIHNVKGYGLGLYYVKDMMGKHGGTSPCGKRPRQRLHLYPAF